MALSGPTGGARPPRWKWKWKIFFINKNFPGKNNICVHFDRQRHWNYQVRSLPQFLPRSGQKSWTSSSPSGQIGTFSAIIKTGECRETRGDLGSSEMTRATTLLSTATLRPTPRWAPATLTEMKKVLFIVLWSGTDCKRISPVQMTSLQHRRNLDQALTQFSKEIQTVAGRTRAAQVAKTQVKVRGEKPRVREETRSTLLSPLSLSEEGKSPVAHR